MVMKSLRDPRLHDVQTVLDYTVMLSDVAMLSVVTESKHDQSLPGTGAVVLREIARNTLRLPPAWKAAGLRSG